MMGPFLMWLASVGTNDETAETQPQWSIEVFPIPDAQLSQGMRKQYVITC